MKILLTGATGFLGSHLLKALRREKFDVVILKRTTSDVSRIEKIIPQYLCFNSDEYPVEEIFDAEKIDVVIHCATVYSRNSLSAKDVIDGNIVFPLRLLEAAMGNRCLYFINTDTFFCKQISERLENGKKLYLPNYTLSKYQFHQWGKLRAIEGKITFINLQMEHIYGPDDSEEKFVKWLETQLSNNVPYVDLTDGIQLRDFVPVDKAVEAYIDVLKNIENMHGYYNLEIGTGETTSIRQFAEKMKQDMESQTELRFGKIKRSQEEIMYSTASKDVIHYG